MRKLVTKRVVSNLQPIPNADVIEVATVDGWKVVVKKGEFAVGDICLFFEIDCFVPLSDERFTFLSDSGTDDGTGLRRYRLRTVRLRKQISQGLALPLDKFPEVGTDLDDKDYAEVLNIIKYERPEPIQADAAGVFPSWIQKTGSKRVQNIFEELKTEYKGRWFLPTLKMDGTSTTLAFIPSSHTERYADNIGEDKSYEVEAGHFIVCSRGLQLKVNWDSHYWRALRNSSVFPKLIIIHKAMTASGQLDGGPLVVQGETCGPGINGARERLQTFTFFAFDLFDVERYTYVNPDRSFYLFDMVDMSRVPVYAPVTMEQFPDIDSILEYAEGPSINNNNREGIVFKLKEDEVFSFNAISNKYLLKHGE